MQGEEIKANDAAIAFQLTRNLCPDPWRLDFPLWSVGKTFCDPTNPAAHIRPRSPPAPPPDTTPDGGALARMYDVDDGDGGA